MATPIQPPQLRGDSQLPGGEAVVSERRWRETIGDLLRQTRNHYGMDVETIAAALRLRPAYIQAIEQGHYDKLPAPVYALGFVRAYATHLGLDGDEAVRRFKQEAAGLEEPQDLAFPVPLMPRSIPGGRMVLAAFVLAVCGYGLWYYVSTGGHAPPVRVAVAPDQMPAMPPKPVATAKAGHPVAAGAQPVAPRSPVAQAVVALPPPAPVPSVPAASGANASPPEPPGASPGVAAASPTVPGAKVYGVVGGPARIVLRATGDSWIEVRNGQRELVAERLLHQGDLYRVPEDPGLVLRTGNASALAVSVDGRPAPALTGTVRRNILLDPNQLLAGTAEH